MRGTVVVVALLTLAGVIADRAHAQTPARAASNYAPLSEYMMPREAEIALARSAAQPNISGRATIKVLTASGFQVAREGDNGFVCLVMRGWAAPTFTPAAQRDFVYDATLRAPICFDPPATRMVLPFYELKHKLGLEGKTPDQIADADPGGVRARPAAEAGRRLVRLHVVRGSAARTGRGALASTHDGLRAVLRQRDAGRQRGRRRADRQ